MPATVAAEWLAAVWDQPATLYVMSPAGAVVEEVAGAWVRSLLGLPDEASVGFVTGCHMANFTALAAARHELLRRAGWDVEANGLQGAPTMRVIVGDEVHVSVIGALRMLGIGTRQVVRVPADGQGRLQAQSLAAELASGKGPTIVCAQAGNVNTGAFDPFEDIIEAAHAAGAWVHVDGAFGLWAAASPTLRRHTRGVERADSWATDAHKWLNVPYDSGLVFTSHPSAHRAAMSMSAAYLVRSPEEPRENMDWVPESSRRARGFAVYAAVRELGRQGVADLIERCCRLARRMADRLRADPAVTILNDVVLNQVLVRVAPPSGDADLATKEALRRVQEERSLLARRNTVAQSGRHARLRIELVHDRAGYRRVRRFDHPGGSRRMLSGRVRFGDFEADMTSGQLRRDRELIPIQDLPVPPADGAPRTIRVKSSRAGNSRPHSGARTHSWTRWPG